MEINPIRSSGRVLRLGLCNVCVLKEAKYNCPACETKSCSLECVKTHKAKQDCSGVRDRLKMIHKEDMDNLTLLSDYRFLEEIDHKLEGNLRDPILRQASRSTMFKPKMPHFMHQLRGEAWKRGITLKYLPQQFSARRKNSTRYYHHEKLIRWHVKLIFHQSGVTHIEENVDENTIVSKLLRRPLNPNSDLPADVKEKLAFYQSASFGGVSILIKNDVEDVGMVFEELFPNRSLRVNLANKTVLEHPVLYVVLKHHVDSYLEYQGEGHDDLFVEFDGTKETQKGEALSYFDAESDASSGEEV